MQPGSGTVVIKKPQDNDAGVYECVVSNNFGTAVSNSVTLLKSELKPFKPNPPLIISENEGEPFKLSCEAPDGWPKPKLSWLMQYVSDEVKPINNSRITLDPEGNLWFSNLTREDASDDFFYVCAAASITKFKDRELGNRVLLNVRANRILPSTNEHKPVLQYVSRKNEVALRGKSVELFCIYGGTPLPQTVWLKNGKRMQFSDRIAQGNYGKSIIIEVVDFDDAGTYTCEVSNGAGEDQAYSINLDVLAAPYFTEEPEFITATEGETVEFRCNASGIPEPQIEWIRDAGPIKNALPPNPRRKVHANSVVIENITEMDVGNYGCKATNLLGYVYKDVYLNILGIKRKKSLLFNMN